MKCYREFEWQIATAKNLTQQHFFRDRQDFDRGSYKMASFDKGQERKKKKKKHHMATVKCKTELKLLQRLHGLCKMNENTAASIGKTLKRPNMEAGACRGSQDKSEGKMKGK